MSMAEVSVWHLLEVTTRTAELFAGYEYSYQPLVRQSLKIDLSVDAE